MYSQTEFPDFEPLQASIQPGTKVLFANVPADGHFNPLTGIAVHLKQLGCDVRWYTAVKYEHKINRLDIPFYPLKKAVDVSANEDIDVLFPERKEYKGKVSKLNFDMVNVFILRGPEYYADIKDIYQEFPFDIMICDITFGGIPFVREKLSIPVVSVSVFPLVETSKDLPPSGLGITPSNSFFGRMKQGLLRFIADRILFARSTRVMSSTLAQYGIDSEQANIFDVMIRKSNIVLQSGTPSFEYKRSDISSHIKFVGPLLPFTSKKEGKKWHPEILRRYQKVILVTQGTVERDIEKIIVPTLEAFKGTNQLVVVTTGGAQTNELKNRYPHANILIEDFIPFDEVMPHADVYISNGGYRGVLMAIQHELPMVVAGVHEGKNEINARIGYFQLGINLKTEKPTPDQLRQAVLDVLLNDRYSHHIQEFIKEFSQYHPQELSARYIANLLKNRNKKTFMKALDTENIY